MNGSDSKSAFLVIAVSVGVLLLLCGLGVAGFVWLEARRQRLDNLEFMSRLRMEEMARQDAEAEEQIIKKEAELEALRQLMAWDFEKSADGTYLIRLRALGTEGASSVELSSIRAKVEGATAELPIKLQRTNSEPNQAWIFFFELTPGSSTKAARVSCDLVVKKNGTTVTEHYEATKIFTGE